MIGCPFGSDIRKRTRRQGMRMSAPGHPRYPCRWAQIPPLGSGNAGAQIGQLGADVAGVLLVLPGGTPPAALAEPGGGASRHDPQDRDDNDDRKERKADSERG